VTEGRRAKLKAGGSTGECTAEPGPAVVAPTAYKAIEHDSRAEHGHGGVWQERFMCKWTEVLREAEQRYTETQWQSVAGNVHKKKEVGVNNAMNPRTATTIMP
jgi:hypothetical protein